MGSVHREHGRSKFPVELSLLYLARCQNRHLDTDQSMSRATGRVFPIGATFHEPEQKLHYENWFLGNLNIISRFSMNKKQNVPSSAWHQR